MVCGLGATPDPRYYSETYIGWIIYLITAKLPWKNRSSRVKSDFGDND